LVLPTRADEPYPAPARPVILGSEVGMMMQDRTGVDRIEAEVGDWLVVPELVRGQRWHAGRVNAVLPERGGLIRFRVRWLGDAHDSLVAPPEGAFVATGLAGEGPRY
jgi:uncharacterized protein DUF1918